MKKYQIDPEEIQSLDERVASITEENIDNVIENVVECWKRISEQVGLGNQTREAIKMALDTFSVNMLK